MDYNICDIPVYIINLKQHTHRLDNAQSQLKKLSMKNINIFEAKGPDFAKEHMHGFFSYKVYRNINNTISTKIIPTWAAGACAISHTECWLAIIQEFYDLAIICEDDITIKNPDILKFFIIEALIRCKATPDSIWFFNSEKINLHPWNNQYGFSPKLDFSYFSHQPECFYKIENPYDCLMKSHFYLVTREALLLMRHHNFPIEYQIDIHMSKVLREKCNLTIMNTSFDCSVYQDTMTFPSTVQYYIFPNPRALWKNLKKKIPLENCENIYTFLPK